MNAVCLIITSPCGKHAWQQQADYVPRVGETVTCRIGRNFDMEFSGIVREVHTEVRKGWGVNEGNPERGMIVSVWLREIDS